MIGAMPRGAVIARRAGLDVAGGSDIRCHWVLSTLTAAVHYDAVKCDGAIQTRNHFDQKRLFRAVRLLRLAMSNRNLRHVNYINKSLLIR